MTGTADLLGVAEALARLDDGAVAAPIERDLLVVSGTDAASYLQGQLSQDVEKLAVGATTRSLLLQPQGKIDAWLRVHRWEDEVFWLDTEVGYGAPASERLDRFKLRVDVTIEVVTAAGLAVRGTGAPIVAEAAVGLLPEGAVILDASWGGITGFDVVGAGWSGDPAGLARDLGIPLAPVEAAEAIRVVQGLPAMGRELDGSTIPAAAGIVDASVDFTKGCYVGQELVARIDSRGNNTPTRLHALRFASTADGGGDEADLVGVDLLLDGEVVGRVTSAVPGPDGGSRGLGYLQRSVEAPATLSVLAGRVTVEAVPLLGG